MLNVLPTLKAL